MNNYDDLISKDSLTPAEATAISVFRIMNKDKTISLEDKQKHLKDISNSISDKVKKIIEKEMQ